MVTVFALSGRVDATFSDVTGENSVFAPVASGL
jgi:hypothetical protein